MDEKKMLDLLFDTFLKLCDFVEETEGMGCEKCPCKEECILKGDKTDFVYFKPVIESVKQKI